MKLSSEVIDGKRYLYMPLTEAFRRLEAAEKGY